MKKQSFNLVEIIISLGIALVCITTIMGMFSVGMQMSDDAIMRSYSNNIVEQMAGLVETNSTIKSEIPLIDVIPSSGDLETVKTEEAGCTKAIVTASEGALEYDPFFANVYKNPAVPGLFKVNYLTKVTFTDGATATTTDVVDFTAMVRIWKSEMGTPLPVNTSDGGSVNLENNDKKLNIEVSWPHKIPYANRRLSGDYILFQKVLKP